MNPLYGEHPSNLRLCDIVLFCLRMALNGRWLAKVAREGKTPLAPLQTQSGLVYGLSARRVGSGLLLVLGFAATSTMRASLAASSVFKAVGAMRPVDLPIVKNAASWKKEKSGMLGLLVLSATNGLTK